MCQLTGTLRVATVIAIASVATGARGAEDSSSARNAYVITPLVSNVAGRAPKQDAVLQNAWGIAFSPAGSPFWVNDNVTGCSTLYTGDGTKIGLQVSIPLPGNVVPAMAGLGFDALNSHQPNSGFRFVFGGATLCFIAGTVLVRRIRGVR